MYQNIGLKMVSVVIPLYNGSETIINCLNSVKNQTYQGPLEIIVVNDGSIDDSRQIVEYYKVQNQDLNIILINQENSGVSKARNVGLKKAKGGYIALLDSDDEWLPSKLDLQLPYLNNGFNSVDFVACNRNGEIITFPYKISNNEFAIITLRKLLFKVVGQTSTAIFKKDVLKNTGFFDENQKYSEDANFWMRISLRNKMILLKDTLVITGGGKPSIGFSGLSSNIVEMEKGVHKNIKEIFNLKKINFFEYIFFTTFSKLKYIKRIIALKIR